MAVWNVGHSGYKVDIQKEWKRILDVGSGHKPFPPATHAIEPFPDEKFGYRNEPVRFSKGVTYYHKKLEDGIPVSDDCFDYAYCNHVLEHVEDVKGAVAELCRISKMGFVEVPSWFEEFILPVPEHLNIFWREGERVCYCRKSDIRCPEWDMWHRYYYSSEIMPRKEKSKEFVKYKTLNYVAFHWTDKFEVINKPFPIVI